MKTSLIIVVTSICMWCMFTMGFFTHAALTAVEYNSLWRQNVSLLHKINGLEMSVEYLNSENKKLSNSLEDSNTLSEGKVANNG